MPLSLWLSRMKCSVSPSTRSDAEIGQVVLDGLYLRPRLLFAVLCLELVDAAELRLEFGDLLLEGAQERIE